MRKRRVLLFDDDPHVLAAVSLVFEALGYEVVACAEPAPCAGNVSLSRCREGRPCADVVVTDYAMPGMTGVELLAAQARLECPITPLNKAVLSGNLDDGAREAVRRLGCACFDKPLPVAQLQRWLLECERRTDLSQPLGALRRERREDCSPAAGWVTIAAEGEVCSAAVLNSSRGGLCVRTARPLAPAQVIHVRSAPAAPPQRFVVRWAKGCVAGAQRGV